jgi:hypothetical protein
MPALIFGFTEFIKLSKECFSATPSAHPATVLTMKKMHAKIEQKGVFVSMSE